MPEKPKESEYIAETSKKFPILPKLKLILESLNPYKKPQKNDAGLVVDLWIVLFYRAVLTWFLDVALTGIVLFLILNGLLGLQSRFIPFTILILGLTMWYAQFLLIKLWKGYVDGKVRIARNYPKTVIRR